MGEVCKNEAKVVIFDSSSRFFSVALFEVTNVDEIFSPLRMQNYLSDKEKPPVQWIDMGDTGHIDERGNLIVSGRSKDVLVLKNSSKINTNTIERLLQKCDAVLEACLNKLSIGTVRAVQKWNL